MVEHMLHLKPAGKPEVLMWTFGGMIEDYDGINSAGVADLRCPRRRTGRPLRDAPLSRQASHARVHEPAAGRALAAAVPLASNGNYVLCDGSGNLADVEATTAGPEVLRDQGAGFLAHTNHFVCSRYARRGELRQSWQDSFPRLERMNSLIASGFGSLSVDDLSLF